MSIQIGGYHAEGPFGNLDSLKSQSGVYVILGRNGQNNWSVVDVGESRDIKTRTSNHDRASCWQRQGYGELAIAPIYVPEVRRMIIERQLRHQYNPSCGKI